jgi:hypothetical protein
VVGVVAAVDAFVVDAVAAVDAFVVDAVAAVDAFASTFSTKTISQQIIDTFVLLITKIRSVTYFLSLKITIFFTSATHKLMVKICSKNIILHYIF